MQSKIIEEARSWIDVKWKHQGRSRELGIDCVGLLVMVSEGVGYPLIDQTIYPKTPIRNSLPEEFTKQMDRIGLADRRVGDVILFRDNIYSCHCGILSMQHGSEHIIHAHTKRRKVIEEPLLGEWLSNMTYCFRYRAVEA